jgi:hypothetical protein
MDSLNPTADLLYSCQTQSMRWADIMDYECDPPEWAEALVELVCAAFDIAEPELRWFDVPASGAQGVCHYDAKFLAIAANSDNPDQCVEILLHELTHHVTNIADHTPERVLGFDGATVSGASRQRC